VDVKTWKEYEDCLDSFSFTAILDERGRISIPASVRKKLRIDFKDLVDVKVKSLNRRIKK
jgi:bifunctional DNA-binding transcriptional regulator/antitoxin component of YhaV-PrlF toxin-antitoxin module